MISSRCTLSSSVLTLAEREGRQTEDSLPLYTPCKMRPYERQTKSLDSFRLLLLEVVQGGGILKNHEVILPTVKLGTG